MTKEEILDEQHWSHAGYKQRITSENWRELLLNDDDAVIFHGRVTPLGAKDLGYGVVEVSKKTRDDYGFWGLE